MVECKSSSIDRLYMGVRAGPAGPAAAGPMFTAVKNFIHDKTTTKRLLS